MNKSIFFALSLALIMLSSAIAGLTGIFIMGVDLYTGGDNFMHGFTVFSLGTILFFVCTTAYIATKVLTNTEVLANTMTKYIEYEIGKQTVANPFQMFGQFSGSTMEIININRPGSMEDMLGNIFGHRPEVKTMDQMSVDELKTEEKKAVDSQDFERAATIRELIEAKKNKNS